MKNLENPLNIMEYSMGFLSSSFGSGSCKKMLLLLLLLLYQFLELAREAAE